MTKPGRDPSPAVLNQSCFGHYQTEDAICRKFCALRLRCAIEHEQNIRLEVLEDLVSCEEMNVTIQ